MDIEMIPQELISADLNGHGNYALVKLTRASEF